MSLLLAFSKEISHSEKVMYGCFDENSVRNAKLSGGVGSSESDY